MTNAPQPGLDSSERTALLQARHADIFSVLGMHQQCDGGGLVVRSLQPGAISVCVIEKRSGKVVASLDRSADEGFFEGRLGRRRKPFHYLLRVTYPDAEIELEDPYRFASRID
ncbi:MAG: 1,4-alpha-glucan branching enzyme, partial [Pseudomonadales bacterium]|nr:1,4-alpha-glucan branching enzyme [Pseudomonadales bacterium]